jgi:alcohol dehydrogenase class IV
MLPRVAIVDPELTHSMPPRVTAFTGMDALVQVLEPLVSNQANPLTDAICREGLDRAARSLRRAYEDGDDAAAREDMALASLCGGLALANAKLGAVHGFAGPFGGMFHSPHGAVCAALLPPVMAVNVDALQHRDPNHPALARYAEIARILTGDPNASIEEGVTWVQTLVADLHIPPLSPYGFTKADFPDLMVRAARSRSMKGNPVALDEEEMGAVLEMAM